MQSNTQEMAAVSELDAYVSLLRSHDWFYDYTDDHNVWKRGREQRNRLEGMAMRLDPNRTIWKQYAPQ